MFTQLDRQVWAPAGGLRVKVPWFCRRAPCFRTWLCVFSGPTFLASITDNPPRMKKLILLKGSWNQLCPCEPRSTSCLGVTAASTLSRPTNNQRQLIAGPMAVGSTSCQGARRGGPMTVGSTSCQGERRGQQEGMGEASSDKVLEGLPRRRRVARVLLHGGGREEA